MATVDVQHQPGMPKRGSRGSKPIIEAAAAAKRKLDGEFNPQTHLAFKAPSEVIMMKDLGYAEDTGVSPVAVSQPFQLFSPEAIQQMRAEVLSPQVLETCQYKSNIAACQLRGYSPK